MIIVLVEVGVGADAGDEVRAAVSRMEQQTRKEPGCVTYAFSTDVSDPTTIRVTERWRSMQDLESHIKSPHMADFQKAVIALQPKSLSVKAYEVAKEVELPR